jgi:hypothetical protein
VVVDYKDGGFAFEAAPAKSASKKTEAARA